MVLPNIGQCLRCLDILHSKYRHDFVECRCESFFLDGGNDYRRVGGDPKDYTLDPNEFIPRPVEWIDADLSMFIKDCYAEPHC